MQPLLKLRERKLVKYTSRMNRESAGKIVKTSEPDYSFAYEFLEKNSEDNQLLYTLIVKVL